MPQGNGLVLAILRSPLHKLLSGMAIELRYTGRRSGRQYVLPVQYARVGDQVVIWVQQPRRKTWWRNFRTPGTVEARIAGRWHRGTARVVEPDDSGWEEARAVYIARWRRMERRVTGPLVMISLDRQG